MKGKLFLKRSISIILVMALVLNFSASALKAIAGGEKTTKYWEDIKHKIRVNTLIFGDSELRIDYEKNQLVWYHISGVEPGYNSSDDIYKPAIVNGVEWNITWSSSEHEAGYQKISEPFDLSLIGIDFKDYYVDEKGDEQFSLPFYFFGVDFPNIENFWEEEKWDDFSFRFNEEQRQAIKSSSITDSYGSNIGGKVLFPMETNWLGWNDVYDFDLTVSTAYHLSTVDVEVPYIPALNGCTLHYKDDLNINYPHTINEYNRVYRFDDNPINMSFSLEVRSKSDKVIGAFYNLTYDGHMFKKVVFEEWDIDIPIPKINTKVTLPDGNTLDPEEYSARWFDSDGNFIKKANTLNFSDVSSEVTCEIVFLDESATAQTYQVPLPKTEKFENVDEDIDIEFVLEKYTPLTLTGNIKELASKKVLSNAEVTVSQRNNNNVFEISTTADSDGNFSVKVKKELATEILVKKIGYFDGDFQFDNTSVLENEYDLEELYLRPINSTYLSVDVEIQSSLLPEETPKSVTPIWSNVIFKLFNETQNREIEDIIIQNGRIYLFDKTVEKNDKLTLTSSLMTKNAEDVTNGVEFDSSKVTDINVAFLENGKFVAEKESTNKRSAVAILFDSDGNHINTLPFINNMVESDPLKDGVYNVAFMDKTLWLSYPSDLTVLTMAGLKANTDFILTKIETKAGQIKLLGEINIPETNIDKYVFGESSGMTTNSHNLLIGNIVKVRSVISFKEEYKSEISDVVAKFALPDNCDFIEDSVTVGGASAEYSFENGLLEIPIPSTYALIYFSVIPTEFGNFNIQGFSEFAYDGTKKEYPFGNVFGNVEEILMNIPLKTGKVTNTAFGTAAYNSMIYLYDNGNLVGTTKTNAAGNWRLDFKLTDPSTFSTHEIYAESIRNGAKSRTSTQILKYNQTIQNPTKLIMHHYRGVQELDLERPTGNNGYYYFDKGTVSFVVDFPNPEKVVNVLVISQNSYGEKIVVPLCLEGTKWMGKRDYDFYEAPVWLGIEYDYKESFVYDTKAFELAEDDSEILDLSDVELPFEIGSDDFWENATEREIDEHLDEIDKAIAENEEVEFLDILGEYDLTVDGNNVSGTIDGSSFDFEELTCDGLTESGLIADGFEKIEADDGSDIFVRTVGEETQFVDITKNTFQKIKFGEDIKKMFSNSDMSTFSNRGSLLSYFQTAYAVVDRIIDATSTLAIVAKRQEKNLNFTRKTQLAIYKHVTKTKKLAEKYYDHTKSPHSKKSIDKLNKQLTEITKKITKLNSLRRGLNIFMKYAARLGHIAAMIAVLFDLRDVHRYSTLNSHIKDCPHDKYRTQYLDEMAKVFSSMLHYYKYIGINLVASRLAAFLVVGIATPPPVAIAVIAASFAGTLLIATKASDMRDIYLGDMSKISFNFALSHNCNDPEITPDPEQEGIPHTAVNIGNPIMDPSGYVYEAVADNRVEGVTATVYFKEKLEDPTPILWDAEEYDQLNPLITDKEGRYAWDVPIGWWQVKYEKEGYETTYSEWLPVPPPQLEVNVGLKSLSPPKAEFVNAYPEYIEVVFDRYMDINSLTKNISVSKDTSELEVRLEPKAISSPSGSDFAKTVHIYPKEGVFSESVTLNILNKVKSYSGVEMSNSFSKNFKIMMKIDSLKAYDVNLKYDESKIIYVHVNPGKSAVGRQIMATSNDASLVQIQQSSTVNEFGVAAFTVRGLLPGSTDVLFKLENSLLNTSIKVETEMPNKFFDVKITPQPESTVESGKVSKGTEVILSSGLENADIYYSFEETSTYENFVLYDGSNIIIDKDMTIYAYAVADGYEQSEINVFSYVAEKGKEALNIVSETIPDAYVGKAYSFVFFANEDNVVWSIVDGALPVGLTLSGDGTISGTPAKPQTVTFVIQAKNSSGIVAVKTFSFESLVQTTSTNESTTIALGNSTISSSNNAANPRDASLRNNPSTGDASSSVFVIVFVSSLIVFVIMLKKKKKVI